MARVYGAWDEILDRPCALKVPRNERDFPRLEREARIGARLSITGGVARVYNLIFLDEGGTPVLALEQLEGVTLGEQLRTGGALPALEAARIARAVAAVVAEMHAAGALHCDLKPDNIFLCRGGAVKVLDFGIARVAGEPTLAAEGVVMGTPGYMAPEWTELDAGEVDGRSDVYGLGVTLYQAVAGIDARAGSPDGRWAELREVAPLVPPHVASLVHHAIERDRDLRCPSMKRFGEMLDACLEHARRLDSSMPPTAPTEPVPSLSLSGLGELVERARHRREQGWEAEKVAPPPSGDKVDERDEPSPSMSWRQLIFLAAISVFAGCLFGYLVCRPRMVQGCPDGKTTPAMSSPPERTASPARIQELGFDRWHPWT